MKHENWYDTATKEDRETLALLEIEEAVADLERPLQFDNETRRRGYREGRAAVCRLRGQHRSSAGKRKNMLRCMSCRAKCKLPTQVGGRREA